MPRLEGWQWLLSGWTSSPPAPQADLRPAGLARAGRYQIRVDSVLDDQWADWFGGLQLSNDGTQTIIVGLLPDQSALHGVLAKIRDLGLCLTLVRRLDLDDAGDGPQV
jgi:hypothetical protein